jgi:hypothetical protein
VGGPYSICDESDESPPLATSTLSPASALATTTLGAHVDRCGESTHSYDCGRNCDKRTMYQPCLECVFVCARVSIGGAQSSSVHWTWYRVTPSSSNALLLFSFSFCIASDTWPSHTQPRLAWSRDELRGSCRAHPNGVLLHRLFRLAAVCFTDAMLVRILCEGRLVRGRAQPQITSIWPLVLVCA